MTVKEFVEKYLSTPKKDRESLVKKHVVNTYIPYEKKVSICKSIVNIAMYVTIGDKKVYKKDTPTANLLVMRTLVDEYTDLQWDNIQNILPEFNLLEENDVLFEIEKIVQKDCHRLTNIMDIVINDVEDEERSLVPYLDTKITSIGEFLKVLQGATEQIDDV